MVGISIKRIRLYYYIRRFKASSDKCVNDHYHVDDLSIRKVPSRYWYRLAFEAYDLSKAYIARKQYNIYCHMTFRVKIKDIDKVNSMSDFRYTYEPFCIYLWKKDPRDTYRTFKYSKKISEIYGRIVYISPDDDEKNIWYLNLF